MISTGLSPRKGLMNAAVLMSGACLGNELATILVMRTFVGRDG